MTNATLALAAIALAVSLLSLLVSIGVIRRLREYSSHSGAFPGFDSGPRPGAPLPEFTASTVLGDSIAAADFANGNGCIAFLSASCEACKSQFPLLGRYVDGLSIEHCRSLVVVAGDPNGESTYAREGARFAQIVLEPESEALVRAFEIRGFPTVIGVRDGQVMVSAPVVEALTHQDAKRERGQTVSPSS
jgi:hypothetical protein